MPEPQRSATMRLIELAEHLTPSGEIGDGLVFQFHEAAALARLEQYRGRYSAMAAPWPRTLPDAPATTSG